MLKNALVGGIVKGISTTCGHLWSIEVELLTGEIVKIETGDEFISLVVTGGEP